MYLSSFSKTLAPGLRTAAEIRAVVEAIDRPLNVVTGWLEPGDGISFHTSRVVADARGDHRMAMAFAIAAQLADGEVRIGDIANVATSFPGFDTLATRAGFGLRDA